MGYVVQVTDAAEKEIRKQLERHQADMLSKKIEKLCEDPFTHGKPLRYPLSGIWELRLEKRWRVLYRIDQENKIIYIVGFKHKDEMQKLTRI